MILDAEAFAQTAYHDFITSKTVKVLLAAESAACIAFVNGILDGTIPLTKRSFILFGASQVAGIVVLTVRQSLAELKAHLSGFVDPATVDAIEARVQAKAIAAIEVKHPEAASTLQKAFYTKGA